ncbi:McrC family protein [Gordonia sp. 'Campus']|uniref:McrC family protein n=1 Tax=Gordonia sp. 'Campus' TaxID=2915824 RepID=UPI001EE3CC71|nr:McrC family protein [Gordonia sp. 'Campus']
MTLKTIEFLDLDGPTTALSAEDDLWLADLAKVAQPDAFVVPFAHRHPDEHPGSVVERSGPGWRAGRYIGQLRRGDRILQISPRLGIDTIGRWMTAVTGVVAVKQTAGLEESSDLLVAPVIARLWVNSVTQSSLHGLPSFRREVDAFGTTVKGRINGRLTAAFAARGVASVAWTERQKSLDNSVSRSIVAADNVLGGLLDSWAPDWRGSRVEEIVMRLRYSTGNRPRLPKRRELDRVRYTPIRLPFRQTAELSWRIANFGGIQNTPAGDNIEGMLIDVAELWELFVLACAREAFATETVAHGNLGGDKSYLLRSTRDGTSGLGRLLPDITVGPAGSPLAIIDAKYKRLTNDRRDPDRGDLYQLAAYLATNSKAGVPPPVGLLAYPAASEKLLDVRAEALGPWKTSQDNTVHFARLPTEETQCAAALRAIIGPSSQG